MKHTRRNMSLALLALLLFAFFAACSSKGVHMPKHRKRRHCDCPTFASISSPQPTSPTATYVA
ncbi:MAG: hypothetical protein IKH97_07365 [Bacteroidales bacterium]|nr:hypothetical protein [Bacteroidales bacterium]